MLLPRLALLGAIAFLLTACFGAKLPASVSEGTCKVFPAPAQEVRGKGRSDQVWINDTIESGVAACHWPRPRAATAAKKRPPKAGRVFSRAPKVAQKTRKPSGGVWVDAILPVPALPDPAPASPDHEPPDLRADRPAQPPAARHWPQTLFDRLDGR